VPLDETIGSSMVTKEYRGSSEPSGDLGVSLIRNQKGYEDDSPTFREHTSVPMNALSLLSRLNAHPFAARLIKGSATALMVSAAGQALTFGLQLLFARELGSSEYGVYSYLVSWMGVGLIVAKGGFDTALVRFVAAYSAKELHDRVSGVIQAAIRQAAVLGVVTTVPICAGAWLLAKSNGRSFLGAVLITGLLIPVGASSELIAAAVRGLGRAARSLSGDMLVRPIACAAILTLAVSIGVSVGAREALGCYLLGTIASLLLSRYFLLQTLSWSPECVAARLRRVWSRSAASLMMANGFLVLLYSVDVLMLGAMDNMVSSGLYNVASKLAVLVLFIMNAAQSVAGPMMAAAYANARYGELQRIVRLLTLLSLLSGVPIAVLLALASPWMLQAFGPGFPQAAGALFVLLAMQCVNVATGPVGLLLAMTGRQSALAWLLFGGVLLNILLNLALIPRFGLMGAAWSSFIAHSAWNIAGVARIRGTLGIDCSLAGWIRNPLLGRG
jgi:O-antigen/teichoic acid export membrane protein